MNVFSHKRPQKGTKEERFLFVIFRVSRGHLVAEQFPIIGKLKSLISRMAQMVSNVWKKVAFVARTFLPAQVGRQECLPHDSKQFYYALRMMDYEL